MKRMKLFIDTHDAQNGTFPQDISPEQFGTFFRAYEQACEEEGVIVLRTHVGFREGRAYCFNMAESADAIKRAHDKVGLWFDSITEVKTLTPGDLFFAAAT